MTDKSRSFAGQGREIRRLCRLIDELALGAPTFNDDLEVIKKLAQSLVDQVPQKRGNPDIRKAAAAGNATRSERAKTRHSEIGKVIQNLRGQGFTYAKVASALNEMGYVPERAEKWTAGLARAFDPDLAMK